MQQHVNVARSNTVLIRPNTSMKRWMSVMSQSWAICAVSASTLSVEIAIEGKSDRKLLSRICFASSGRNGTNSVAIAIVIMLPKLAMW